MTCCSGVACWLRRGLLLLRRGLGIGRGLGLRGRPRVVAGDDQPHADGQFVRVAQLGAVGREQLGPAIGGSPDTLGHGGKGVAAPHGDHSPARYVASRDAGYGQSPADAEPVGSAGQHRRVGCGDEAPLAPAAVVRLGQTPEVVTRLYLVPVSALGGSAQRTGRRARCGGRGSRRGGRGGRQRLSGVGHHGRGRRRLHQLGARQHGQHRDQQASCPPLRTGEPGQPDTEPLPGQHSDGLGEDGRDRDQPGQPPDDTDQAGQHCSVVGAQQGGADGRPAQVLGPGSTPEQHQRHGDADQDSQHHHQRTEPAQEPHHGRSPPRRRPSTRRRARRRRAKRWDRASRRSGAWFIVATPLSRPRFLSRPLSLSRLPLTS